MIAYLIIIISFLFDGILTNFLPYLPNHLSFFTPLLTLTSLIVIMPLFRKQEKKYFLTVFLVGLLNDLFYTNLLFFNAVLFFLVTFILYQIHKKLRENTLSKLIEFTSTIILYESLTGMILFLYQVVPVTIPKVFYKISHSLFLNLIYGILLWLMICWIPEKYKKIRIN